MRSSTVSLQVEALESRALPAGTVTATLAGGILTLTGDSGSNALGVQISGNIVTVWGKPGTTISGGNSFTGVNELQINLYGGHDQITITGLRFPGDVTINLGAGHDTCYFRKVSMVGDLSITGAQGRDKLELDDNLRVNGNVTVDLDHHRDAVEIQDRLVVLGTGQIDTDIGDDYVSVHNAYVQGNVNICTCDGNDVFEIDYCYLNGCYIDGGSGWDGLHHRWDGGPYYYHHFEGYYDHDYDHYFDDDYHHHHYHHHGEYDDWDDWDDD